MKETWFEKLLRKMVQSNSVVIGYRNCDAVAITSPVRLATSTYEGTANLLKTALLGHSKKEVIMDIFAAATMTLTHTAEMVMAGVLVRIAGPKNSQLLGPYHVTITSTLTGARTIVVYPTKHLAEFVFLLTSDNGGEGQPAASAGVTVAFPYAAVAPCTNYYPANSFAASTEPITLRDFTSKTNEAKAA